MAKRNLRGVLLALIAFGIFATHDVAVKFLGGQYAPFQVIFFSVLLTFPLVSITLMRDPTEGHLRPIHPWWSAVRTLAGVIGAVSVFYAFSVLPLAQVYAILFATPLLITILSIPILGERVRMRRWAAVIVGLIGVLVVLRPGSTELTLGHAAALTGAFVASVASIIVRKIGRAERPIVLMLYPLVANFVVMGAMLPVVYEPMPLSHFGLVAVISALSFVAGLLMISAYRNADAALVAPMQYSQILWATAYGALLFNEYPDTATLAGAGIIIASGVYIVFRESRGNASTNTPVLRTRSRHETGNSFRVGWFIRRAEKSGKAQVPAGGKE